MVARFTQLDAGIPPKSDSFFSYWILPEVARRWRGAQRSAQPASSFAAVGHGAKAVTSGHQLTSGLGEDSPLGRIYELAGDVLLLGWEMRATPLSIWPGTRSPARQPAPREPRSSAMASGNGSLTPTWPSTRRISRDWKRTSRSKAAFALARLVRLPAGCAVSERPSHSPRHGSHAPMKVIRLPSRPGASHRFGPQVDRPTELACAATVPRGR
jgi:hypothetical protein